MVLDLETERDAAVLGQMMNGADVVVEDFRPGYLAQKGLITTRSQPPIRG